MIRPTLFTLALLGAAGPAAAADQRLAPGAVPGPDPAQQAMVQMLQEAQAREAQALLQVYTLRSRLTVETARADAAEARLKKAEPTQGPAEPAPPPADPAPTPPPLAANPPEPASP